MLNISKNITIDLRTQKNIALLITTSSNELIL